MSEKPKDTVMFKKVCVLGKLGVGKSSLIEKCPGIDSQFSHSYSSLIGLKISRKNLLLESETGTQKVYLIIWNIENNLKFSSLFSSYIKGASGGIIIGDVSRPETLDSISWYIELFLVINPQSIVIVILNKSDLVTQEELSSLIAKYNFDNNEKINTTYITSTKKNHDINQIFYQLAKDIC